MYRSPLLYVSLLVPAMIVGCDALGFQGQSETCYDVGGCDSRVVFEITSHPNPVVAGDTVALHIALRDTTKGKGGYTYSWYPFYREGDFVDGRYIGGSFLVWSADLGRDLRLESISAGPLGNRDVRWVPNPVVRRDTFSLRGCVDEDGIGSYYSPGCLTTTIVVLPK